MPASRYLFLIAGVLGVFAMFRPIIGIGRGPVRVELSAYEMSFGLERTHKIIDRKWPALVEKRVSADVRETRDDIKLIVDASKHTALAYIPAGLILLLGAIATLRKRSGRVEGVVAIVLGLAQIATWIGLLYGVAYGKQEEPALARLHLELKFAAHILLITGLLAIAAGIQSIVKPDAKVLHTNGDRGGGSSHQGGAQPG